METLSLGGNLTAQNKLCSSIPIVYLLDASLAVKCLSQARGQHRVTCHLQAALLISGKS